MKILCIDNSDSFSWNLGDEFEKRDAEVRVYRNDIGMGSLREIVSSWSPDLLVISPGPSTPSRAGICLEAVRECSGSIPVFGVCLGHQVIVEAFGGVVGRAPLPVHGKASLIEHDGEGLFEGMESPLSVGRYHSLVGSEIPDCLEVSARFGDLVMALRHREHSTWGVQFHPESILSPGGGPLIDRVLELAKR